MRFTWNHMIFEVPADIDVVVTVNDERADFDFVKDGEVIAMMGGHNEAGEKLPTWKESGIKLIHAEKLTLE